VQKQLAARVPRRAKKSTARDHTPHGKKSHLGPLLVNAKSIMQNPWRWLIFRLCILFWEFANNNKC
jgi:hypothetical protein